MSTTTTHRRPCSSQAQDAAAAVGWARSVLSDPDTVILDTETTDLPGRIVQISAIDVTGQVVINTLVNPQCPISLAATAVHGLRTADLLDAPTLQQIWATVQTMLTAAPLGVQRPVRPPRVGAGGHPAARAGTECALVVRDASPCDC